jgi:hypothetical protein
MASAVLIETPTDFRETLGGHTHEIHTLVRPTGDAEPVFRAAFDAIFGDLVYISIHEPEIVGAYLNGIEQPLRDLGGLGCALFAIVTRGTMTFADKKIPNWLNTHYFVIFKGSYFAVGDDLRHPVHRFDPSCEAAVHDLAHVCSERGEVRPFRDKQRVLESYEDNVPWCSECCIDELCSA